MTNGCPGLDEFSNEGKSKEHSRVTTVVAMVSDRDFSAKEISQFRQIRSKIDRFIWEWDSR